MLLLGHMIRLSTIFDEFVFFISLYNMQPCKCLSQTHNMDQNQRCIYRDSHTIAYNSYGLPLSYYKSGSLCTELHEELLVAGVS